MHYEEMLTWLLFYTSLLDLRKIPAQDVADPGGLVKSQVIESADGSAAHRAQCLAEPAHPVVALPDGGVRLGRAAHRVRHRRHRWRPSAQLKAQRRAAAADPGELLRRSRGQDRPAAPSRSTLLKAHNILYDREGDAEYLQVYTETFDQRFFFEIVERRGYRGYGAANAPVRLAAQARLSSPGVP